MSRQDISLKDRFDLSKSPVLMNGTQALVRLMLMQKARDRAAGLNTAGYVTGYRGSPLGGVDQQMAREGKLLGENDIRFQPGLNEDLAATAIWGTPSFSQASPVPSWSTSSWPGFQAAGQLSAASATWSPSLSASQASPLPSPSKSAWAGLAKRGQLSSILGT